MPGGRNAAVLENFPGFAPLTPAKRLLSLIDEKRIPGGNLRISTQQVGVYSRRKFPPILLLPSKKIQIPGENTFLYLG